MKSIKNFIAVIALSTLSFGAFAAQEIATVSVSGAKSLDAFEAQVAQKAKKLARRHIASFLQPVIINYAAPQFCTNKSYQTSGSLRAPLSYHPHNIPA